MSDIKFSSIVDELCGYVPHRDREHFIENRAENVIASFVHLVKLIETSYDAETAEDLKKRLLLSVKNGDGRKLTRKLREMRKGSNGEVL